MSDADEASRLEARLDIQVMAADDNHRHVRAVRYTRDGLAGGPVLCQAL
jgi:hypothetical protein